MNEIMQRILDEREPMPVITGVYCQKCDPVLIMLCTGDEKPERDKVVFIREDEDKIIARQGESEF